VLIVQAKRRNAELRRADLGVRHRRHFGIPAISLLTAQGGVRQTGPSPSGARPRSRRSERDYADRYRARLYGCGEPLANSGANAHQVTATTRLGLGAVSQATTLTWIEGHHETCAVHYGGALEAAAPD